MSSRGAAPDVYGSPAPSTRTNRLVPTARTRDGSFSEVDLADLEHHPVRLNGALAQQPFGLAPRGGQAGLGHQLARLVAAGAQPAHGHLAGELALLMHPPPLGLRGLRGGRVVEPADQLDAPAPSSTPWAGRGPSPWTAGDRSVSNA